MVEEAEVVEEVVEEVAEVIEKDDSPAFMESFLESMTDEEVKGHKMWENLKGKDANEVGRYFKELKSFTGKKGDIPGKEASDEEWSAFRSKLSGIDNIEGYDFELNSDFKDLVGEESLPFYEGMSDLVKDKAYALGATPDEAEGILGSLMELVAEQQEGVNAELKKSSEENLATLDKEWGEGVDAINGSIDALMMNNGMTQGQVDWARENGIFTEPAIAIPLAKLAAKFEDDPEIGHHQTQTQAGVADQIAELDHQMGEYISKGEQIPQYMHDKRNELWTKVK